ncbi:MAG: type II toxin-antitoxin system RelE/ParE family toxin [Pseudorhodoplanes sp.]
MSRTVVLLPDAEVELSEAAAWYAKENPQVAKRFNDANEAAIVKLGNNPLQYQVVDGDLRRAPLTRFPHGLLYWAAPGTVVIASCFHGRRNPSEWRNRIKP